MNETSLILYSKDTIFVTIKVRIINVVGFFLVFRLRLTTTKDTIRYSFSILLGEGEVLETLHHLYGTLHRETFDPSIE